jgi:hypothetical protein
MRQSLAYRSLIVPTLWSTLGPTLFALAAGCGNSSSPPAIDSAPPKVDAAHIDQSGPGPEASTPLEASVPAEATTPAEASSSADSGCINLTVHNYDTWCMVQIGSNPVSSGLSQTVCVPPGTVTLTAMPNGSTFTVGSMGGDGWHDTTGAGTSTFGTITGEDAGTPKTTTTIDVSASNKCAWVCCPFAPPTSGGCPANDSAAVGQNCP